MTDAAGPASADSSEPRLAGRRPPHVGECRVVPAHIGPMILVPGLKATARIAVHGVARPSRRAGALGGRRVEHREAHTGAEGYYLNKVAKG